MNLPKLFTYTKRNQRERSASSLKFSPLKKVSQGLALLMSISVLLPVIALGAPSNIHLVKDSWSYNRNTGDVSARVYVDTYTVNEAVYLQVYSPEMNPDDRHLIVSNFQSQPEDGASVGDITYFTVTAGIGTVNASVYDSVYINTYSSVEPTVVTDNVYVTGTYPTTGGTSSGGGGGGFSSGLTVSSNGSVDANGLKDALAKSLNVTLTLSGDIALIPASALLDAAGKAGATITLVSDNGSYTLPLSAIDLNALAKSLGIDVADLTIKVSISKLTGDAATAVTNAVYALGGTQLSDSIDFKVEAISKNDATKKVDVNFGNTYVSRTINVGSTVNSSKSTGILFNDTTKKASFVPTTFNTADSKTVATLKRAGNSIYTVAQFDKNFADIASHWSQADVQLLANKLVVDGVTDTAFQPDRNITRAEFAALVVRSLGLDASVTSSTYFNDVKGSEWYAGVVTAAAKANIVNGYEDGTFRPDDQITREELAAMVVRASNFSGTSITVAASQQADLLNKFKDSSKIVWAKQEIASAISAGYINGLTDTTIGSDKQATRSESATMLKRFLSKASFIN